MTGNTVLLGMALGRSEWHDAALSGLALAGFSLGAIAGSALRTGRAVFALEALALAVAAGFGGLASHEPAVVAAACGMGIQTAGLLPRNRTGVKVTYITGTLTSLWARLAAPGEERTRAVFPATVWLSYGAGALGGALLTRVWGSWTLLVPIAIALAAALRAHRVERPYWMSGSPKFESGSSSPVGSKPSRS